MKSMSILFRLAIVIFISLAGIHSFAQTPGGINYQGVARNQFLVGLNNDSIQLRFTVKEKTVNGPVLYTETRGTRTDSFGVFSVVIGAAGAINQSGDIKLVPWSDTTKKFLMVELNIDPVFVPQFLNMGTTQLLSVPFSFYSDISDSARISAKADSAKFAARADSTKFSNGSGKYFFSVGIPADNFQIVPNNDGFNYVVKFPTVYQNDSGVFNPVTSVFTAPDSGYYQFNITGAHLFEDNIPTNSSDWRSSATAVLTKNATGIKILHEEYHLYYSSGISTNKIDEGLSYFNASVVIKLAKNDQVSIRLNVDCTNFPPFKLGWSAADYEGLNLDSRTFAEFSGYKIK